MLAALLRYAWASPATLLGLAFALVGFLLGARGRVVAGALEVGGGRLHALVGRLPASMRFGAITLGHVIVGLDAATLERCREHEQVHVRQYERWGALFFPLYLGSSLGALLRGGDPYLDNFLEREAFRQCHARVGPVESSATLTTRSR